MTATQTCALSGRWTFGQKYTLSKILRSYRIFWPGHQQAAQQLLGDPYPLKNEIQSSFWCIGAFPCSLWFSHLTIFFVFTPWSPWKFCQRADILPRACILVSAQDSLKLRVAADPQLWRRRKHVRFQTGGHLVKSIHCAKEMSASKLPMPCRCMWQCSCIKLDAKLQSICRKSIACQVFLA